jgi:hypothetical protein
MVYIIIDEVEVTSEIKLEEIITDLSDESKIALRGLFQEAVARLQLSQTTQTQT